MNSKKIEIFSSEVSIIIILIFWKLGSVGPMQQKIKLPSPYLYSSKFSTPSQNVEFHIHRSQMEIGLLRRLNFVLKKWLRGNTSCLHAKRFIYFRMWWQSFSQKTWFIGRDAHQDHESKFSRSSSPIFMINRIQFKSKRLFEALVSAVCQEN